MIGPFKDQYRFLSNFWPCKVSFEGGEWASSEHAYQAAKTLVDSEREALQKCKTAGQAKRLGRTVTLRATWNDRNKIKAMRVILRSKFTDNTALFSALLATEDQNLVEVNTWGDTFWGMVDSKGENHLGRLLMELRKELDI